MNLLGLIMRFNPPPQLEALDNVQATAQIGAGSQSFAAFGMLPKGGADNRNAFLQKKRVYRAAIPSSIFRQRRHVLARQSGC
jgi:hypothetical protein